MQKNEGLIYKKHPLRRIGNMIYYGSMAEPFIIMMQIKETRKEKDLDIATKVSAYCKRSEKQRPYREKEREEQPVRSNGCFDHLVGACTGR